jgi:hypothetical protein
MIVIWSIITYLLTLWNFTNSFVRVFLFQILMFGFIGYRHGWGDYRRVKRHIIDRLDGEPFPENFSCEVTPEHIVVKSDLTETKFGWGCIKDIRIYKQYIEFVGTGFLIHLRVSESPPIDDIIAVWNQSGPRR